MKGFSLGTVIMIVGLIMVFDFLFTGCGKPPVATLEPEGIETIIVEEIEVETIEDTWETIKIQTWD